MKELDIFIVGKPGSGKTTITSEICALFDSLGFQVEVEDPDLKNRTKDGDFHQKCLDALRQDGLSIQIITKGLRR